MPQFEDGYRTGGEKDETDQDAPIAGAGASDVGVDTPAEGEEDAVMWLIQATRAATFRTNPDGALDEDLRADLASGLTPREHMLDLIKLARAGLLPEVDSDLCHVVSLMLAEISAWVAEYDSE